MGLICKGLIYINGWYKMLQCIEEMSSLKREKMVGEWSYYLV